VNLKTKLETLKHFLMPASGRKGFQMPDTQTTATTPAASGGLSKEEVAKLVSDGISAALNPLGDVLKGLADGQKALAEKLTPPAPAAGKETAPAALTAADVAKIVQDNLKTFQTGQSKAQAKAAYAADKLKDLPATYQSLLPETDDPAALAKAEQDIRARFKAELGDKLAPTPNVASPGGGAAPEGKVDLSKLTSTQLIEHGIKAGLATTAPSENRAAGTAAAAQAAAAK
jgi:hypothetical protein